MHNEKWLRISVSSLIFVDELFMTKLYFDLVFYIYGWEKIMFMQTDSLKGIGIFMIK